MLEFYTTHNKRLVLDVEGTGVTFLFVRGRSLKGDVLQIAQSWASIHALLAKLRNYKEYAAIDNSLSVRMQDQELCLHFHIAERKLDEECKFSPAETARIMDFLGKAPNLN